MALWQLENAIRFGQCLNNLQQYKKWNQYLPSTCSLVNFSLTKEKRDQFIKMNLQAANCGHGCIFEIIKKQPKHSIMEIASSFWHELDTYGMNCAGWKHEFVYFKSLVRGFTWKLHTFDAILEKCFFGIGARSFLEPGGGKFLLFLKIFFEV